MIVTGYDRFIKRKRNERGSGAKIGQGIDAYSTEGPGEILDQEFIVAISLT